MKKTLYFCLLSFLLSGILLELPYSIQAQPTNVTIGANSQTPGQDNVLVGYNSGINITNGTFNTFVGSSAGRFNTIGNFNAFIGTSAGYSNTEGVYNTFLGFVAGNKNTIGNNNSFVGAFAGNNNEAGDRNVFLGTEAGRYNTGGRLNTFVGFSAGRSNTSGSENIFIGGSAGYSNVDGYMNVFMGSEAGLANTKGFQNTFIGFSAGRSNTTGTFNTFVGYKSGSQNETGVANVFIGSQAGSSNTIGTGNMFLGQQAGFANTTASYNLFIGNASGGSTTTGLGNTAIGDGSLLRNNIGIHNVAIGRFAGVESRNDENTFIGFAADVTPETPNLTNATAIGARARVSQSNSIVLGANANVAIGNSAPTTKLHITTGTANTSGLRLENLTSSSPASLTSQYKFLTVDGSGNVVLGSVNGSAREAAGESLWQRKGQFLENTQGEAVIIGQGVSKTSSDYNLFVSKGILTEKVKVAVKNTDEWSDKVFEPGYVLKSLPEVEQHIKQTGHLPGIPSAQQMVEQGNDLHKTDAKLLEKIEELTLYSIQLEKKSVELERASQLKSQQQQAEIDELKRLVKQLMNKR